MYTYCYNKKENTGEDGGLIVFTRWVHDVQVKHIYILITKIFGENVIYILSIYETVLIIHAYILYSLSFSFLTQ